MRSRIAFRRRGISTLWVVLTLPIMMMLVLYAVESGRLHLARQQLNTSLESAAMAAAKRCATGGDPDSVKPRDCAIEFAAANLVLQNPPTLTSNYNPSVLPNENDDCAGDIVLASLVELSPTMDADAGVVGGCADKTGPNAVSTLRTSTDTWQTVTLCNRDYTSLVVVGTIDYQNPPDPPLVVRIQNVGTNSFEFLVQNVNNGVPQAGYDVNFLVVEEGVYTNAADGVTMEAFTYNSTRTDRAGNWLGENRGYANAYANPVVVGQVMSFNDPDWSVFWSHNGNRTQAASAAGLYTGKHVGEDFDTTRANETVGYIVFEEGLGDLGGLPFYAGDTGTSVGGAGASPFTFTFPANFGTTAVASHSGERGGNGAFAFLHGPDPVDPGTITLQLDEDQIANAERNHVTENVHYVVLAGPCVARVQHQMQVNWYFSNLFGCVLDPPTVQGQATAYFDCADDCSKLFCPDSFTCP